MTTNYTTGLIKQRQYGCMGTTMCRSTIDLGQGSYINISIKKFKKQKKRRGKQRKRKKTKRKREKTKKKKKKEEKQKKN